jgi:hypothetical protein
MTPNTPVLINDKSVSHLLPLALFGHAQKKISASTS